MAKKASVDKKLLAELVTETADRKPCAFCQREIDDEITYGKLYSIGNIQCHYFCVLLSCCLIQKGKDEQGLFGFLYPDILAEVERSKKHRCSYCGRGGATLGCCVSQCRKQFHLPCGRERNAVSLFFGNFKSYCAVHAPKQKIADDVMTKARVRMRADKNKSKGLVAKVENLEPEADSSNEDSLCVICYEEVQCYPTNQTFWPPCCARDKWFHRSCLQRMALSAGMHYLKCPLCNDKENFYQAVISQGYYVPDRDAAWELEQNAFAEIYERELTCSLPECLCPLGRDHDSDNGPWDIKLCLLCGSVCAHAQCLVASGDGGRYVCVTCRPAAPGDVESLAAAVDKAYAHAQCLVASGDGGRYVCVTCRPAAPGDVESLAAAVDKVVLASQLNNSQTGPVMPSRMSLRRTKQRQSYYRNLSSSSQSNSLNQRAEHQDVPNLTQETKPSKYKGTETILKDIENTLLSPVKLIEQGFREKAKSLGAAESVIEPKVLEKLRHQFRKPKPLSEKRKIVDGILEDLVSDIIIQKKPKTKEPVRAWFSPKKDNTNVTEENQLPPLDTKEPETNKNLEESKSKPETSENDITKSNDVIIDNPASSFELPSSIETIDTSPPDDIAIDNAADNSENESVAGRRILRRTKQRQSYYRNSSTSSQTNSSPESKPEQQDLPTLESSREELNLKTPKRYTKATERTSKDIENTMLSPVTLIEQGFRESIESLGTDKLEIAPNVLEKLRHRFRKPKPMSRKRKIMDGILEDLVNDAMEQNKTITKEPASPIKDAIDVATKDQVPKLESPQREIQEESHTNSSIEKSNTDPLQTENSPDTEGQKSNEVIDIDTDDDSRSTFELPPEFIADDSNSIPIFDTPKKLKTVEIQKDSSMEISEDNNVINIDLVQIENANDVVLKFTNVKSPAKNEFCAFKFSPRDKESLEENTVDIDLESFKSQYLNEVDRDFKCTFSHKHSDCNSNSSTIKLKTAIDFALEAASKEKKVKIKSKKKSKRSEGTEERKSKKNQKRKRLKLVYVWKSDPTLNLSPSKTEPHKTLKQYVLKYADKKSGEVIGKPEKDVTPIKKKHFKNERSPDNLIQTSIQNFFKLKSNEK